jgi:hypothetical protein
MAVESLVFAPFFATHGGLLFKIFWERDMTSSENGPPVPSLLFCPTIFLPSKVYV